MIAAILFYLFALGAVGAGFTVITRRNPISAAVALVVSFFCLSCMYVLLDAHFVAVTQVLVYAGAIMVLFIFVIMLLNLGEDGLPPGMRMMPRVIAGLAAAGMVGGGVVWALCAVVDTRGEAVTESFGTIEHIGMTIFGGQYLLPFEVASALLTVAMVGSVVLAKREV